MTDFYSKLIEALDFAAVPDRSLDRLIHQYVSATVTRDETFINGPKDGVREIERAYPFKWSCWFAPRYTESLTAAASLVPTRCQFTVGTCNEDDLPWACVTDAEWRDHTSNAAMPELALCLASIKAREAQIAA